MVEKEGFSSLFEGVVDTRTVLTILVLLRSKLRELLPLSLKPNPSERKVGKHNSACDSMRSEKHLCLSCKGLVSTTCKLELGETRELQKFPKLRVSTDDSVLKYYYV